MNYVFSHISYLVALRFMRFALVLIILLSGIELAFSQPIWYELEDAELNAISLSSEVAGYTGTGYLTNINSDDSRAAFELMVEKSELYELQLGYRTPNGEKEFLLKVNGETIKGRLPAKDTFSNIKIGKVLLKEGANEFVFEKGWGWYELDNLQLYKATAKPVKYPEDPLIDRRASVETERLFEFLKSVYGQKMISAQQTLADVAFIKAQIGVSPAIANIDLMDYSPSRVAFGANAAPLVENAIDWTTNSSKIGIIGMSWHWNAPTDLINTTDHEWWRGFYTHATTFNFAEALEDTSSENYQLILRDIDAIAVQLKKFQSAGVPILWRPLHEASGGWFWWGAQGEAPYIKLWKLLVTRLRDHHNIHNLIWVYTTGDSDWYPGDEWVDVVGHDIYTEKGSSLSAQWDETFEQFNGKKMVALTESGTLPLPNLNEIYGTWWSWYSLWSASYVKDNSKNELTEVFTHPLVINRENLPNWQEGIFTSTEQPEKEDYLKGYELVQNYPNPFNPSTNISYSIPSSSRVLLKVFNTSGQEVATLVDSNQSKGAYTVTWDASSVSSGIYFYQIIANSKIQTKKMILIK